MAQANFFQQDYQFKNYGAIGRILDDKKNYRSITIEDRRPENVYQFFRNLENLPYFMKGVLFVRAITPVKSRWGIQLKSGHKLEWDSDIIDEIPGVMISWQSLAGAEVTTSGAIWFIKAPRGKGTIVNLSLNYDLPSRKAAELTPLFTSEDPDSLAITNLRRLKAFLETGEIPTISGQASGREPINFESMITRH